MCGIAGYFNLDGKRLPASCLDRMTAALAHRGPDDSGRYLEADGRRRESEGALGLGHRRLSVLDLSSAAGQPMSSAQGRYLIVHNGEIYNHLEIRGQSAHVEGGRGFRTTSDTETILAAFERRGWEAVNDFVGMFAFAIFDRLEQGLYLFRDRLGIKPLLYFWDGTHFAFASTLRALQAFPLLRPRLDSTSLGLYLQYEYVPSPRTIFENCYKLEAGQVLKVSREGLEKRSYWSLSDLPRTREANRDVSARDLEDELDSLIRDSIRLRLLSDVPVGALLSGGIDSSTVVSMMQSVAETPVRTYSVGFQNEAFDEAPWARAVAAHLGTVHREHYFTGEDLKRLLPEVAEHCDEPFADPSILPTMLVSAFARQEVTVALTGDGGDELFWGYRHYRRYQSLRPWLPVIRVLTKGSLRRLLAAVPHRGAVRLSKSAEIRSPFDLYNRLTTTFGLEEIRELLNPAASEAIREFYRDGCEFFRRLDGDPECASLFDIRTMLSDKFLTKVDRASMRVALEARVPLLDHRIVEFSLRVPFNMKFRDGQSKYILRKVLERYVPKELVERPKKGFSIPLAAWLRQDLRPVLERHLGRESVKSQGIFQPEPVSRLLAGFNAGDDRQTRRIWTLLMFQTWLERSRTASRGLALGDLPEKWPLPEIA